MAIKAGLDDAPTQPTDLDRTLAAAAVDAAEVHLVKLLGNFFYYEAYQRLRMKKHPSLKALHSIPIAKGELALRHQHATPAEASLPRRGRGRPAIAMPGWEQILRAVDGLELETGKRLDLVMVSQTLLRWQFPNDSEVGIKKAAVKMAEALRDYRKKLRRSDRK